MIRFILKPTVLLGLVGAMVLTAADAQAIPAFARKYKLGCNACHTIYPQLNRFGRDFRDNGFRMPDEIQEFLKKSTPAAPAQGTPAATEDFWSFIPDQMPFSIQAKLHDKINPKGGVKSDFQLEELQLQGGGTFTPRVSYYLHHHLAEEGEPGDLYTGWVRFNNLAGSNWLNVTVGQIELPLSFSPEIERLSSFGYLAFDRQLGVNTFNLNTPQLGVQVFGQSEGGTKLWAGVVNGTGLAENEATDSFDSNSFKDVYARVGQEIGEHFVGGFVYYGRTSANGEDVGRFDDRFVRVGGDAFVNLRKVIVYGTALYARDDNPLGIGERRSFFGAFAQGDVYLNDRTIALIRVDAVRQKLPALFAAAESEAEIGENSLFRVNTIAVTPGVQFLARPNVKLGFEYQIRQTRQEDRALAQLHLSF
jgi:hypothetical protein